MDTKLFIKTNKNTKKGACEQKVRLKTLCDNGRQHTRGIGGGVFLWAAKIFERKETPLGQ